MKAGAVIRSTLINTTALTTLLGGNKVYPVRAPQLDSFPYMVYSEVSTDPSNTKDGQSTLDAVRVQIDSYAATYADVAEMVRLSRNAMEAATGTVAGVLVDEVRFLNNLPPFYNDEYQVFQVSSDYEIRIKNPTTAIS